MKKYLFLFSLIILMSACALGGYKINEASTGSDNLQCSFVLDSPVGYDIVYGVGFSGVVYENGKSKTQTLWIPQALYEKIICDKDSKIPKIYKGKCLYCKAYSQPAGYNHAYFVYFVE